MRRYSRQFSLRLRAALPLRALLALIGAASIHAGPPASAQASDYRSRETVPPAWTHFSGLVKSQFEQWLAADEAVARRFRTWLAESAAKRNGAPSTLVVLAWLGPDGSVERVTFASLGDDRANEDLRQILTRGNVAASPPPEMLQPLHFRLSLNQAN